MEFKRGDYFVSDGIWRYMVLEVDRYYVKYIRMNPSRRIVFGVTFDTFFRYHCRRYPVVPKSVAKAFRKHLTSKAK